MYGQMIPTNQTKYGSALMRCRTACLRISRTLSTLMQARMKRVDHELRRHQHRDHHPLSISLGPGGSRRRDRGPQGTARGRRRSDTPPDSDLVLFSRSPRRSRRALGSRQRFRQSKNAAPGSTPTGASGSSWTSSIPISSADRFTLSHRRRSAGSARPSSCRCCASSSPAGNPSPKSAAFADIRIAVSRLHFEFDVEAAA